MERVDLKKLDIMYDVTRLRKKSTHNCNHDSENSDIVRLKKQIRKTKHVEEKYVQFLMLLYNFDNSSQSYSNEGGNEHSGNHTDMRDHDEDKDAYVDDDMNVDEDDDVDFHEDENLDSNEDEDENDPEYMKFLSNAKADRKSYAVRIDTNDGLPALLPAFVEFEKEDASVDENEHVGKSKTHDACKELGNDCSKDKVEHCPLSGTVPGNDNDRSSGDNNLIPEPLDTVSPNKKGIRSQKLSMKENRAVKMQRKGETKNKSNKEQEAEGEKSSANFSTEEKEADIDEDYSYFLENFIIKKWHLKAKAPFVKKRKPYSRKVVENDCKTKSGDDDTVEHSDSLSPEKPKKRGRGRPRKNHTLKENGVPERVQSEKRKRPSKEPTTGKRRKTVNVDAQEDVAGRELAIVEVKEEEVSDVDEALFRSGHIVEYQATDDLQILNNDNDTLGKEGSFNLIESSLVNHFENVEDGCPAKTTYSDFRLNVEALLERPYDQKEYRKLRKAVKNKKHVVRNMDLRQGGRFYSTGQMGKSYLEYYKDLRKKIKEVGDRQKRLNILRGFFFWLQNLTQEGAFQPWNDPEWLSLVSNSS